MQLPFHIEIYHILYKIFGTHLLFLLFLFFSLTNFCDKNIGFKKIKSWYFEWRTEITTPSVITNKFVSTATCTEIFICIDSLQVY